MTSTTKRRLWIGGGVVVVILMAVVAAPFVYIHFIEADPAPKLSVSTTPTTTAGESSETKAPLAGTWNVADGSKGQYRVNETLFGQSNTATGVTDKVSGSMTIADTSVTATKITVDLTGLTSSGTGSGQRDNQVQGRILNTAQFPDATFTLTKPIALGKEPADGVTINTTATGTLTLHGTTKAVTITDMKARRDGNVIQVSGSVPITFSDYGIDNPSGGPAQVGNNGTMEFLVVLHPAP